MKLLLSLLVSVLSLEAFAGYIVPNIRRDSITFNEGGSAIGLTRKNNNVGVVLGSSKDNEDYKANSADTDETAQAKILTGAISVNESLHAEFLVQNYEYERESDISESDTEYKTYFGNLAYTVSKEIFLGLNIYNIDFETDEGIDRNHLSLSGTFNLAGNHYLGGGVGKKTYAGRDLDQTVTYFGYGFLNENLSVEGLAEVTTAAEDSSRDESLGTELKIIGNVNWVKDEWDIIALVSSSAERDDEDDETRTVATIFVAPEYKFTEMYFAGLTLRHRSVYYLNEGNSVDYEYDDTTTTIGVSGRMKLNSIQVLGLLTMNTGSFDDKDDDDFDYDKSGTAAEVYINYFF